MGCLATTTGIISGVYGALFSAHNEPNVPNRTVRRLTLQMATDPEHSAKAALDILKAKN